MRAHECAAEGLSLGVDSVVRDTDHSQAEDRWITLGLTSAGRLVVVCHTFAETSQRRCRVRIISSRKATKKEREQYGG